MQDADAQTMQVNLGDIPGSLVGLGRPPLPVDAKVLAEAAQLPGPDPAQSPRDATVMEHRVAGDLVMGKLNKSMKKSMARSKSKRKKGSHKSDGSARSRKSVANSDLQVPSDSNLATGPNRLLAVLLALGLNLHVYSIIFTLCVLLYVAHLVLARWHGQLVVMQPLSRRILKAAACFRSCLMFTCSQILCIQPHVALVISSLSSCMYHSTHARE